MTSFISVIILFLTLSGTDRQVSLTLVNDWIISDNCRGIDVWESWNHCLVLVANPSQNVIECYNAESGTLTGSYKLDLLNADIWGIAWNNDITSVCFYTNDHTDRHIFFTDNGAASWTTPRFTPHLSKPRGLDYFQSYLFQADGSGKGIWAYSPDLGGYNQYCFTPEASTSQTGLTVFPYNGETWIAVSTGYQYMIYFYRWNGLHAPLTYMGASRVPVSSILQTLGLSYSYTTGNLFLTYYCLHPKSWHLAEVSFSITALERTSWGAIKNSFRLF